MSQGITDPETMEVLAFREGLALANDLVLNRVRIANDCANAVTSIVQPTLGAYTQITREIKADAIAFQEMEFACSRERETNHDAHMLARSLLFNSLGRHVWVFDAPYGAVPLIRLLNKEVSDPKKLFQWGDFLYSLHIEIFIAIDFSHNI